MQPPQRKAIPPRMVKSTSDFPHYRWNSLKCPFGPLHLHFLPARSVPRFHPLQGHGKKRKKPKNHFPHYRCMSRKWLFPSASFPLPFFPPMASDDRFDAGSSTFLISSSPPSPSSKILYLQYYYYYYYYLIYFLNLWGGGGFALIFCVLEEPGKMLGVLFRFLAAMTVAPHWRFSEMCHSLDTEIKTLWFSSGRRVGILLTILPDLYFCRCLIYLLDYWHLWAIVIMTLVFKLTRQWRDWRWRRVCVGGGEGEMEENEMIWDSLGCPWEMWEMLGRFKAVGDSQGCPFELAVIYSPFSWNNRYSTIDGTCY